jgi:hypothetical protein
MDLVLYKNFCIYLCVDTKENEELIERVSTLPEDICIRIFNEFSSRVLIKKIHPIDVSDIKMGSFPGYRRFCRINTRDNIARRINLARLRTAIHLYVFIDASGIAGGVPITISEILLNNFGFIPSRRFLYTHIFPQINSLCFRSDIKDRLIQDILKSEDNFVYEEPNDT